MIRQDPDLVDFEEWLSGWPVQLELDTWRHS
jgi:hypothetical protein